MSNKVKLKSFARICLVCVCLILLTLASGLLECLLKVSLAKVNKSNFLSSF